jgi:hypothetical protein
MGGNAPGAARNTFGLAHAVSFLIESRGVGIGREGFQRRVATHYLAAEAVLETAAEHAAELRAMTEASRHAESEKPDIIVAHELAMRPVTLPMFDPATGEPRPTAVTFRDSRTATPTTTRTRPAGYLILDPSPGAIGALRLNNVTLCRVAETADIEADAFTVRERAANTNRESINPDQAIKVDVSRKTVRVPEGAKYIPARQPGATLASLALEPDSPGSLTGVGALTSSAGADELPIYRLAAAPKLAPVDLGDPSLCK